MAYVSPYFTPGGEPRLRIYRDGTGLLLSFPGIADFQVHPLSVTVFPADDCDPSLMRQFLLGPVLAVELELLGIPCLHASAVTLAGGAVGFLATSTGGKSVLASSFVESGAALLTDDILPLRRSGDTFWGEPGYPQMKVWPEAARELMVDDWSELDRVIPNVEKRRLPVGSRWGAFCSTPQPLQALYVPVRTSREDAKIEVAPLSPSTALIELVRHSFCARVADALGWQPRRLSALARLAECVPVRRLQYPSGFENLPTVQSAILRDLQLDKRPGA